MRGHIRKRGNKYAIVVDVGYDDKGKRKQKWFSGYVNKKDAEKDLPKIVKQMQDGTYVEPSAMKLSEYLKIWYSEKKETWAAATQKNYDSFIRHQINPTIGNKQLNKLKSSDIITMYETLKIEQDLSGTTRNKVHILLKKALDDAVLKKYTVENVVHQVDAPRRDDKEMNYWSKKETRLFLKKTENESYNPFFLIAVSTGMRPGELLGLKWKDINLEKQSLYVRRALQRNMDFGPPKANAYRSISLDDHTLSAFKKQRTQQKQEKMKAGPHYNDQDLVFATSRGNPISHRNILRTWYRMTEPFFDSGELTKIRLYDLRHTHATILLQENVHPKIVSERLGHSSIRMTLDKYSHVTPSMQRETAETFGKALFD